MPQPSAAISERSEGMARHGGAQDFTFESDGAALYRGAALSILSQLCRWADEQVRDQAGLRLSDDPALRAVVDADGIRTVAARHLPPSARSVIPVRAILFDKSPVTNWSLGWHQDRTIVVRERHEMAGFGPWSRKHGLQHVEPPFTIIEQMVTLRIHLDDVPATNAPLIIAPGSHRVGRVPEDQIIAAVEAHGRRTCEAEAGDIWVYATPILHASDASSGAGRRRVLQVDFAGTDLPLPLEWRGI